MSARAPGDAPLVLRVVFERPYESPGVRGVEARVAGVVEGGGEPQPFWGWVELVTILEATLGRVALDDGAETARSGRST